MIRGWWVIVLLCLSGCYATAQRRADQECVDLVTRYGHRGAICIGDVERHRCTCADPSWDLEWQSSIRLGPIVDFDACTAYHDRGEL